MGKTKVLKKGNNADILKAIENLNPELRDAIDDLPIQGTDLTPIGELVSKNGRYKNAFLNTVNLIGLTVIKKNIWENPWSFTTRGTLAFGQQVREIINDLANIYDYNENFENVTRFLENVVPNVHTFIHEINYQKFYQTTTSDEQIAMAFTREGGLIDFIEDIVGMLYESLAYDIFLIDKYMLCRALLNGLIAPSVIEIENKYAREIVSQIKGISNKMTFRSPNYNPAGIRRATSFDDQILIVSSKFEGQFSTEVLATSYFRDEADMRSRLALVDDFGDCDDERLTECLGDMFIPFTDEEKKILSDIPAVLISREWFMDYDYRLTLNGEEGVGEFIGTQGRYTEFFNPTNFTNNHFLSVWRVFSFSPYENATVFVDAKGTVTGVSVSPDTATISVGGSIPITATVTVEGIANKAVTWTSSDETVATVDSKGIVKGISAGTVTITATSIYDNTQTADATITVQ